MCSFIRRKKFSSDICTIKLHCDVVSTIAGNATWYAVWAIDVDNNGIPDYNQVNIVYNKGAIQVTVTGLPQTQAALKGSTVTVSKMGVNVSGYVIIGWHTSTMPIISIP
jgi:hypothetical protein